MAGVIAKDGIFDRRFLPRIVSPGRSKPPSSILQRIEDAEQSEAGFDILVLIPHNLLQSRRHPNHPYNNLHLNISRMMTTPNHAAFCYKAVPETKAT